MQKCISYEDKFLTIFSYLCQILEQETGVDSYGGTSIVAMEKPHHLWGIGFSP
jgi:hypothetical protein